MVTGAVVVVAAADDAVVNGGLSGGAVEVLRTLRRRPFSLMGSAQGEDVYLKERGTSIVGQASGKRVVPVE